MYPQSPQYIHHLHCIWKQSSFTTTVWLCGYPSSQKIWLSAIYWESYTILGWYPWLSIIIVQPLYHKRHCGEEYGYPCWTGCTTAASLSEGCTRQDLVVSEPQIRQNQVIFKGEAMVLRVLWLFIFWKRICLGLHIMGGLCFFTQHWTFDTSNHFFVSMLVKDAIGCNVRVATESTGLIDTSWSEAFVHWEHSWCTIFF